jgi:predicted anti-sigma-YlaC factor YlaD
MNCRQAQQDIALFVGQDLDDPRERDDVKRHVATCPDCRAHYRRLKGTLKVLAHADAPETYTTTGSLWPELAGRINNRRPTGPRGRFNGWAPFVAMMAACLVLMVVVNEPQSPQGTVGPATAKGPTVPVIHDITPLLHDISTPPRVRFEKRTAADDLEELRRDREEGNF